MNKKDRHKGLNSLNNYYINYVSFWYYYIIQYSEGIYPKHDMGKEEEFPLGKSRHLKDGNKRLDRKLFK